MKSLQELNQLFTWFWVKQDAVDIYDAVAASLRGGSTAQDALESMADYAGERKNYPRADALRILADDVRTGSNYAEGFKKIANQDDLMLLAVSQRTPNPAHLMQNIADLARRRKEVRKAALLPTLYPLFMVAMGFLLYAIFGTSVLPKLLKLIPPDRWPLAAYLQLHIAKFLVDWWMLLVVMMALLCWLIYLSLSRWTGGVRDFFDSLPIYGTYKTMVAGNFLYTMTFLAKSQTDLLASIEMIRENSSAYTSYQMKKMLMRQVTGVDSDAMGILNVGLVDRATLDLLRIVSKNLSPAEALQKTAIDNADQLLSRIKLASAMSGAILFVFGALLVVAAVLGTLGNMPTIMDSLLSGARR
jgi:type II secretory pathway component PulF